MALNLFGKKTLGIDIGASSIKIVELSKVGNKKRLENYAEFRLPLSSHSLKNFHSEDFLLLSEEVATILRALLKKLGIKEKRASFSLPDFSTFFTTFSLPPMSEAEIPTAIEFEARHHIPLPLSEVTFDWQIVAKEEVNPGFKLRVLLVAVPNKVLINYQKMAELCGFDVRGMEAEVFGLIRSSVVMKKNLTPVCLVDFGWQSTTVSVVNKGNLVLSHSFDISGTSLTTDLSTALQVDMEEAEDLKKRYGLDPKQENVSRVLLEKVNGLAIEIEKICQDFYQMDQTELKNLILSGGTASLFGLEDYLTTRLRKNVDVVNPFGNIVYPASLQARLQELGPLFAVAVGVAAMGVDT